MSNFPTVATLTAEIDTLILPHFTIDDAWTLGNIVRGLVMKEHPKMSAAIQISLPTGQILFSTYTCGPTVADSESWLSRKAAAVFRFGISTLMLGQRLREAGLPGRLLSERAMVDDSKYACHGGGVPIKVRNVEGVVAALVVSGLKQEDDHEIACRGIRIHASL